MATQSRPTPSLLQEMLNDQAAPAAETDWSGLKASAKRSTAKEQPGFEDAVDQLYRAMANLDDCKRAVEQARGAVKQAAAAARVNGAKTVRLAGTYGNRAQMTWSDRYADVSAKEYQRLLVDKVGDKAAGRLWRERVKLTARATANTTAVMAALVKAGLDVDEHFSVSLAYSSGPGLHERAEALMGSLTPEHQRELRGAVDHLQTKVLTLKRGK